MEHELLIHCDLCGGETYHLLFIKEGYRHVRCSSCGLVFVNPRSADHLEMQQISGTGSMGDDTLTASQKLRLSRELRLMEPFRNLNRILEVGAGRGWFLREAADNAWETWAVEINRDALRHLDTGHIHKVIVEPAEEFDAGEACVDVVRIWDVIEHLLSPRQAVARINRVLRPGGLLRMSTTNFASLSRWVNGPEWVYLNGSDHIFLFEPPTIERLLAENGFANIRIRTRSFNMRRKLYHPEEELVSRWLALKPFRKLIDECMRFTRYGHQMIVTAVKTQ
ncbi:MAG TPA: class I SAM-dependent methyltransferase [Desulfomonilaceae bacterium]|nr:class I SAM-dependent methyltransferase [Desulfomonilaceae bacterium]